MDPFGQEIEAEGSSVQRCFVYGPVNVHPSRAKSTSSLAAYLVMALASVVTTTGAQATANTEQSLQRLFLEAKAAQARQDYCTAATRYKRIVEIRPDLAEAWADLGVMHQLLAEYDQANNAFNAALRRNPRLFAPNLLFGTNLLRLKRPSEALRFLKVAYDLNPNDKEANLKLGEAYAAIRAYPEANRCYDRAVLLDPNSGEARYGSGITYLHMYESKVAQLARRGRHTLFGQLFLAEAFVQQGRANDAIRVLQQLASSYTTFSGIYTNLGIAFLANHQILEAKTEFERELGASPGFLRARLGLAQVFLEQGDYDGSARELSEVWEHDSKFVKVNVPRLGLESRADEKNGLLSALDRLKADSKLIKYVSQLQSETLSPFPEASIGSSVSPSQDMGRYTTEDLFAQGRYTECEIRLAPRLSHLDAFQLILLVKCAYYTGDYRVGFEAAEQASKTERTRAEALYWGARSLEELAIDALSQAGMVEPNSAHVHLLLADAYREMENYGVSEAEYRHVLLLNPTDVAAHLGLATVYWQSREPERALPELQKVLEANPQDPEANYLMGAILVAQHQYAEAGPHVVLALNAGGETAVRSHAMLGKIYAAQGRDEDAIKELRSALTVDQDGSIHYQLYRLYKEIGDSKSAEFALKEARKLQQQEEDNARLAIQKGP